ncbi:hypothetical protein AVEN_221339-1 [Araneus ventricosus]|uniref:Tc1-like transposase DDE domain-containing protein n=1 Tax=Araneus ventricosus TaxID=182803 RepID=A0A4Y2B1H1_ARAVE|nr:hypothetical protein AVEN_221339-1 [Araneus ventricosus]
MLPKFLELVSKTQGILSEELHQTGLKRSSMQKILRNSLRMFPYKIQSQQAIPIKAVQQRFDFANEILTMIDNEEFDVGCIWFTDEAHFHLNGFVNKQNWRFWGTENPHLCEEKPLHLPKVTAWVAVCSRGIIGPSFIRETISSECYITILEQFVSTQLALEDRPRIKWFIQDGARPHRTEKVFCFLDEYFGKSNCIGLTQIYWHRNGLASIFVRSDSLRLLSVGRIERRCLREPSLYAGRA